MIVFIRIRIRYSTYFRLIKKIQQVAIKMAVLEESNDKKNLHSWECSWNGVNRLFTYDGQTTKSEVVKSVVENEGDHGQNISIPS